MDKNQKVTTRDNLPLDFTDQKVLDRMTAYVDSLVTFDDIENAYNMVKSPNIVD